MPSRLVAGVAALAALLSCAEIAQARKDPRAIAIDATSKAGVLLVELPADIFDYQLVLQKEGSGGFGSRIYVVNIESEPAARERKFEARTLTAGRYVLKYVMQQKAWLGCLEDRSYLIEIRPGAVNYLGFVDARPTLKVIQDTAVARGETEGGGIYYDGMVRPELSKRGTTDLAVAEQFVATVMVKTRAPTQLAAIEDYSFRQPDDRNRKKRACD